MENDLLSRWRTQYPELFKECFEVWLPQGWISVVEKRLPIIEAIRVRTGLSVEIAQIKEKFGGLRFYLDFIHESIYDEVSKLVDEMEKEAEKTCEYCGQNNDVTTSANGGYWIRTRCADCLKRDREEVPA